jgi:hypothetical protein
MVLMIRETVVPIDDLRYVQIECSNQQFKSIVVFDLQLDFSMKGMAPEFTASVQCPVCKVEYKLGDGIKDLINAYRRLSDHHTKIGFRVKQDSA